MKDLKEEMAEKGYQRVLEALNWRRAAESVTEIYENIIKDFPKIMQTIRFKNFDFYPNQKILDIGCGQGRHCFGAYMHADLDVYGIDMGFDDVKKANENFNQFNERLDKKSCNFIVGNAKTLPFEDNSFDHVVCSEVLEHIIDYESALKEIKRVLKPDGTFALSVPKFFLNGCAGN